GEVPAWPGAGLAGGPVDRRRAWLAGCHGPPLGCPPRASGSPTVPAFSPAPAGEFFRPWWLFPPIGGLSGLGFVGDSGGTRLRCSACTGPLGRCAGLAFARRIGPAGLGIPWNGAGTSRARRCPFWFLPRCSAECLAARPIRSFVVPRRLFVRVQRCGRELGPASPRARRAGIRWAGSLSRVRGGA